MRVGEVADMISKEQVHVPRRENDQAWHPRGQEKAKKLLGFETTRHQGRAAEAGEEAKEATAAGV